MRLLILFFSWFNAIWLGYLVSKIILSNYFFSSWYPFLQKYTFAEHAHTICTTMLSIRLHFVCVCSAFAYEVLEYAEHFPTKKYINYVDHTRVLSMNYMTYAHVLSLHLRKVCICSAFATEVFAYAQHSHTNHMCELSIRISTPKYPEHTLTLFV